MQLSECPAGVNKLPCLPTSRPFSSSEGWSAVNCNLTCIHFTRVQQRLAVELQPGMHSRVYNCKLDVHRRATTVTVGEQDSTRRGQQQSGVSSCNLTHAYIPFVRHIYRVFCYVRTHVCVRSAQSKNKNILICLSFRGELCRTFFDFRMAIRHPTGVERNPLHQQYKSSRRTAEPEKNRIPRGGNYFQSLDYLSGAKNRCCTAKKILRIIAVGRNSRG